MREIFFNINKHTTIEDVNEQVNQILEGKLDKQGLVQHWNDSISQINPDIYKSINDKLFKPFPEIRFRTFGSTSEIVDLSFLQYLTNVENICLEIPDELKNIDYLKGLSNLKKAEFQIAKVDNFDFLPCLKSITKLRLERASCDSIKPNFKGIKELPYLEDFMTIGYKNGIESITDCKKLKRLHIQGIPVKDWSFFPKHNLDYTCLSFIKCDIPFNSQYVNTEELDLRGMDNYQIKRKSQVFSKIIKSENCFFTYIYMENLNMAFDTLEKNGYTWTTEMKEMLTSELRSKIEFDPEAGGLSIHGNKPDLEQIQKIIFTKIKALNKE